MNTNDATKVFLVWASVRVITCLKTGYQKPTINATDPLRQLFFRNIGGRERTLLLEEDEYVRHSIT